MDCDIAHSFAVALWFGLPIVTAGLLHVTVIKLGVLPSLASIPLDGGITWRGRTLFGRNKTVRGALAMVIASMLCVALQVRLSVPHDWARDLIPLFEQQHPLLWGALAGAGYIVGELPNSFVKRQLSIGPGETAAGPIRIVFWTVDQIDSMMGVLIFLLLVWMPTLPITLALLVVTLVIHPAVALIMFALGLKKRVG
jgi:hypothetical protein